MVFPEDGADVRRNASE